MSDQADWSVGRSSDKLPSAASGIVADFRAIIPPEWERYLARAALAGVPVFHWKQIAESLTGMVEMEHLSENNFGSLLPSSVYRRFKRLVFVGRSTGAGDDRRDRLTFACVHPGAEKLGVPAVREVSFYLKGTEELEKGFTLMRREDQTVDDKPGAGGAHYPLLENVLSLEFHYTLNGKDWKNDWHHGNRHNIPRLVRIGMRVKIGKPFAPLPQAISHNPP